MNKAEIRSELLTGTMTPAQVLQYAVNEQGDKENQRADAGWINGAVRLENLIAPVNTNQQQQTRRFQQRPRAQ